MTELVHLSIENGVATITLDSPRNRNALSRQLTSELAAHLATATGDDTVRFVVLTHTGSVFCSGADLSESGSGDGASVGTTAALKLFRQIVEAPQPVIAVLRGPVRAGGTGLVAAADIALVADHVDFAFAEVAIGVAPAIISIPLLAKLDARAVSRYFLSAERFDAAEAARIGLITEAVPEAEIDSRLAKLLATFRRAAPGAVAATKRVLTRSLRAELAEYGPQMVALSAELFAGDEARAGMHAFLNKFAPPWAS
ncbi:enoyl-CoA hydratase family protein [Nocardia nova]|uniref:enoyl-CoA hydratase family protein n=1 Tax=Nocardia nova TaxID=37330 RepID=UPI0025B0EA28|nr:enoyl-CoA hydratase family protein [Nocardia nova]MDN2495194.1 enoyl-CoA hydratase family protein [Nocardia nova]